MAESSTTEQLGEIIKQLLTERQKHVDAIAAIDEAFAGHGIQVQVRRGPGRLRKLASAPTAKKASKGKRTRGKFKETADEFVKSLLKGGRKLATAQINARWEQAGRAASADNVLSRLTKDGELKREQVKGTRGSKYSLA